MKSYPSDKPNAGEVVTPNELNDELAEVGGVMHQLDRDNFVQLTIDSTKLAIGAWGNLTTQGIETVVAAIHVIGKTGSIFPIPDAAGNPWQLTFYSSDCELQVTLGVEWQDSAGGEPWYLWVGIRLDGVLVVQSPTADTSSWADHAFVTIDVPVPAGLHILEYVYGLSDDLFVSPRTLNWGDRSVAIREIAR